MKEQQKNQIDEVIADPELRKQLKAIVLERAMAMPASLRVAIGSDHISQKELVKHIQDEDEIGKQMMAMDLGFLQALTSGSIYAQ